MRIEERGVRNGRASKVVYDLHRARPGPGPAAELPAAGLDSASCIGLGKGWRMED